MASPFEILGIPVNSTVAIAKISYRKLVMIHHPDKGGNAETFKIIQRAWESIQSGYRETPVQILPAPVAQPACWSAPLDVGWMSRPQPQNIPAKPRKVPQPWKFNACPDHILFAESLTALQDKARPASRESALLGERQICVSPLEAYTGFSKDIQVDGETLRVDFGPAHPHGFKKQVELGHGHVIAILSISQGPLLFKSADTAKVEKTVINGGVTQVIRTGEIEIDVQVAPQQNHVTIETCCGELLKVLIPASHDRALPLFATGYGYYDWFPEFNSAGSIRGNLRINFK